MSELAPPRTRRLGKLVAVIASTSDLRRALRLRRLPDLFELRLDALYTRADELLNAVPKLRAPLIITARHPQEGGLNHLGPAQRQQLLAKFLPVASYIDIELRSLEKARPLLAAARALQVGHIISVHHLRTTPRLARLHQFARAAGATRPAFLKVVTRTEKPSDVVRLLDFFGVMRRRRRAVSVANVGQHARVLRVFLALRGSALIYTHLGTPLADGQWFLLHMIHALERNRGI